MRHSVFGRLFGAMIFAVILAMAGNAGADALSAARYTQCKNNGAIKRYLMAASTSIYRGGLVMINSSGLATPAAAAASNQGVVGVATESKTSASSGDYWILVSEGWCKFAGATLGQDDVGVIVYATDDQTVDETVCSNCPVAGLLVEYISASSAWIHVSPVYQGRTNAITEPITLTAALTLSEGATIGQDGADNEVEISENSEDFSFVFASNSISLSSDTGVVAWDFGAVGTTITLANGQTLVSDTNNEVQVGDNSEDISFGFGTANECTITTDTGVTRIDAGDIGLKTSVPLMLLDSQYFCGQGANGATASYIGPVLTSLADDMTTYVYGAVGCDGLDSTTEATADAVVASGTALKVVGMMCQVDDGGTDDTYAFQLRDDTADVTGVTCSVTLDGSGFNQCTVILDAPVTVAAGSTMAVKQSGTDDDCSSCDTECVIYYSY